MEYRHTLVPLLVLFALRTLAYGSRPRLEDAAPRIIEHPSDLIVSKGEPATLNCKAEGRPTPMVEWYKDGERVETDREDPRSHRMLLPSGSLFFLRIVHGRRSKPDEGVYVCVARNYLGEAVSRNASLEVAILRDDFRQTPSDVVVAAGEPAVMECIPPRGHPEPTISWKRNNIRVNDRDERITIRGGKLMISNTRKSDAGMYVCVGTNMVGEKDSDPAELVVFERPVFTKQPVNQVVLADDTVDFFCEVHGDPPPTVRWRREEGELPRGRRPIHATSDRGSTAGPDHSSGSHRDLPLRHQRKPSACCLLAKGRQPDLAVPHPGAVTVGTFLRVAERRADHHGRPGRRLGLLHLPGDQRGRQHPDQSPAGGGERTFGPHPAHHPPGTSQSHFSSRFHHSVTLPHHGQPHPQHPVGKGRAENPGKRRSNQPDGKRDLPDHQSSAKLCEKRKSKVNDEILVKLSPVNIQRRFQTNMLLQLLLQLDLFFINIIVVPDPGCKRGDYRDALTSHLGLSNSSVTVTDEPAQMQERRMAEYVHAAQRGISHESADSSAAQTAEPFQLPGPPHKPIVTDVSKNSVSLTWQPNAHEGGAAVTSYIIEAFSQSAGSTWQTVADMVKMETHTITGLLPNTIYLFIVRAVNAYGLSDPSPISEPVRTQDVSPTGQGVDHRQVQRELGEVAVQLQDPVTLTTASIRVSWTVDRQSQFVQGYRLFYRPSGGTWLLQDINSPSERSTVLTALLKGTEYEIKIRPYFDEFQGKDSRTLLVRTPEEVPSAPPRAVTVATVKLSNSTAISVTWEPPPSRMQNGIIQEYRVWCVGSGGSNNQTRYHVNRTVDGNVLSTVLRGLIPGVLYQVEVAAVTSAGIGTRSQPVSVLIKPPAEQPSTPGGGGAGTGDGGEESSVSLAEQITDVVKQPAFIAGIGGACWVILMGFSVWIYCRRKKRKELSHYTASFAYTPAVGFPHGEASGLNGRPGVLGGNMGNYPWLADSWPTTNLVHSGKEAVNCCTTNHDTAERYYNAPSTPPARTCTASLTPSTPPPPPTPPPPSCLSPTRHRRQHTAASSSRMTDTGSPSRGPPELRKPKQKAMGKAVKTPSLTWMEALPPPPPIGELEQCEQDEEPLEHEDMDLGSDEEWCPPLPERTYLMEGCEDGPQPPQRNIASSPATSYSHQSTATLTPSPHEEARVPHDLPRLHQPDSQQLSRRLPCGPVPVPQAPSPPLTQSNPNLSGQQHHGSSEVGTLQCQSPAHRCLHSQGPALDEDSVSATTPVHSRSSPADTSTPPNQKSRVKKKVSKSSAYRRDIQGDLPPPPEPPPEESRLQGPQGCTEASNVGNSALSSLERSEYSSNSHQRKGSGQRHAENEDMMAYSSKAGYLSRSQMSSNCSTTGSSSSRGSTGSRGLNSARKHNEEMR
ncbi:Roundabout-like protein 2 [Larimichthys crocea]|uniref:Uncharacterized protein n=1 Tax=Larimichthys crocea TaxID=215358 RepID=A0ACD3R6Q0_LARCR|nr:Roundabout-like protein 2 [Larimichthys crocea]